MQELIKEKNETATTKMFHDLINSITAIFETAEVPVSDVQSILHTVANSITTETMKLIKVKSTNY